MKRRIFALLPAALLLAGAMLIYSCEKDEGDDENGGAGHNAGMNCLTCHKTGGEGEGVFTVGGTVYNSSDAGVQGAVIKLYSNAEGTGQPVATMTSDRTGNFHTSSSIAFGSGVYARITSGSATASMMSPITSGACNSCHGVSVGKIVVQ